MAASTISNSGGPGSSTQLSPITIKVRDKIIEQYSDQSLDAINESLKRLLANEEDEQKRLGVLAARVYILRQRISGLSNTDDKAVLTAKSPTAANLDTGTVEADTEWTRLRIIKDCEVNGVRFPKSFIIDVKSADALKLVEAGNAEPVEADAPQMPAAAVAEQAAAVQNGRVQPPCSYEGDKVTKLQSHKLQATNLPQPARLDLPRGESQSYKVTKLQS